MSKSFFDYFPPPRFLEFPYIGIDITPKAIRFIEILKSRKGFRVGRFAMKKLASYDPAVSLKDNKELGSALSELRQEFNLELVEAALPEEKAYLFKTAIPNKTDAEIRNNIEFHLEENVPLSLEESIFDYHVIKDPESQKGKEEKTEEASVSVLPSNVVNEYVEIFKTAGLTPVSFLIESQAIAKAIVKAGDRDAYLVVHIDDTRTEISIVSEETVQFTSTLAIGADDFTAAIVKQLNISVEEAEKLKREKGFVKDKENTELYFTLISTASLLKDEIERVYVYWLTHSEKGQQVVRPKVKKILLTGYDVSIVGFKEYLALATRTETEIANVWTNTFSFEDYIPPIQFNDSLNYGAAIGLALPKLTK